MITLKPVKPIPGAIALGLTLLIWFVIPTPEGVQENAWQLLALFIGTIAAIIGKALPIGAISVIAISAVALTQVTHPGDATAALNDALSGFSNNLIWLIGISMIISVSLNKTGLGARIGYWLISLFGKRSLGIAYSLTFSELILAPVTPSNTARGGGIIHPIMKSIADSFDSQPDDPASSKKIGRFLALVNYNTNPITSAMFITATAPNPLIVNLIAEGLGAEFRLTWSAWAIAAIIPGILSLLIMPLVIYFLVPPTIKKTPNAPLFAKQKMAELGKMSLPEIITAGVFILLLLMWAEVPDLLFGLQINAATAAFIGLSILLITGVLTWDDALSHKSAWDTVMWFSALIMMATFLGKLGLVKWLALTVSHGIDELSLGWILSMLILVLIYVYTHYFFASTTAHITAMFGAFLAAGVALGAPPMLLALTLAFSSSLMMSLTHYATGTAPIIFGSNYATLGEWWRVGFVMSVVNLAIWFYVGGLWWKVLGYW